MRNRLSRCPGWALALVMVLAAKPAVALPSIETWTTPAGARVYFVENH